MAAPMRTCFFNNKICYPGCFIARRFARSWSRRIRDVQTSEEEVSEMTNKLKRKSKTTIDPKRNPLVPFLPDDPVQKNIHAATSQLRRQNIDSKTNHRLYDRNKSENDLRPQKVGVTEYDYDDLEGDHETKKSKWPFKFEKLEKNDPRFGRSILQAQSKKDRPEHQSIVLEGKKLIIDALKTGTTLKTLYFAGADSMLDFPVNLLNDADVYKVQYNQLKLYSDVASPQGLLGIFKLPLTDVPLKPAVNPVPFTLVLDAVRDGGNLGTLIHIAAAVGCSKVIVMKGCVDIWNSKVVRAATGGHFRVPLVSDVTWPQIHAYLPPVDDIRVFLASNHIPEPTTASLEAVERIEQLREQELLNDPVEEELDFYDKEYVKHDPVIDERFKNRQYKSKVDQKQQKTPSVIEEDKSYTNLEILNAYMNAPLSVDSYETVDYMDKHPVVVLTDGSSGFCLPAKKLAYDHYGGILKVPREVDSLSCTVMGSVLMYEIAKQLRNKKNDSTNSVDAVEN